jgi:hypothetical protein
MKKQTDTTRRDYHITTASGPTRFYYSKTAEQAQELLNNHPAVSAQLYKHTYHGSELVAWKTGTNAKLTVAGLKKTMNIIGGYQISKECQRDVEAAIDREIEKRAGHHCSRVTLVGTTFIAGIDYKSGLSKTYGGKPINR